MVLQNWFGDIKGRGKRGYDLGSGGGKKNVQASTGILGLTDAV